MPYPNFHAARLKDPKQFDEFAMKKITNGVILVLGIKNGKTTPQSYRFKREIFTADQAKKWLKDNNVNYISFEEATGDNKKSMMQSLIVQAFKVPSISPNEILSLIPQNVLSEIKKNDPHPLFQAYSFCHEGTSQPRIIGDTAKPIHWLKQAIQSIKGKVQKGIKFFLGHNEDNSTNGREALGEIVADIQKEIDGNLHHIAIGYFPNKEKVRDLDICSLEGVWNLFEKAGSIFAESLDTLTGIALASSKENDPAFEGARRLSMVQAFNDSGKESNKNNNGESEMDLNTVPFSDLLGELKRRNVQPVQVFTLDEIKKDKEFGKEFQKFEKLETESKEKDEKIKTLEKEKAEQGKTTAKLSAKQRYDALLEKATLTDKQRAILKDVSLDDLQDFSDDSLSKFFDKKLTEYKTMMQKLGVKDDLPAQKREDSTNNNNQAGEIDYGKKENNPLLTEDVLTDFNQ